MDNRTGYGGFGRFSMFPPVLKTLLIINVAVYLLQMLFLDVFYIGNMSLGGFFVKYFYLWPLGENSNFFVWQLISYQFIHGGFMHLFFNLFALWMFGSELESLWGSRKFLVFYLLCGIGAGIIQLYVSPIFSPTGPTVGASGSIFGILLAFGLTYPDRPIFMFPFFIPIPAKYFVMLYAGIELLTGITSSNSGVAHFAHLGGALTGFLLIKFGDKVGLYKFFENLFKPKQVAFHPGAAGFDPPQRTINNNFVYHPNPEPKNGSTIGLIVVDGEIITQITVDTILDKISAEGYTVLSDREKKILMAISKGMK